MGVVVGTELLGNLPFYFLVIFPFILSLWEELVLSQQNNCLFPSSARQYVLHLFIGFIIRITVLQEDSTTSIRSSPYLRILYLLVPFHTPAGSEFLCAAEYSKWRLGFHVMHHLLLFISPNIRSFWQTRAFLCLILTEFQLFVFMRRFLLQWYIDLINVTHAVLLQLMRLSWSVYLLSHTT